MVLAGADIFHRAFTGGDEIDGMDDGAELPQGVLHARIVDRRPLDRDLDALRFLVDFVQGAHDPVDAFEARQPNRHLDQGRLVRLQHIQHNPLDVGQRTVPPGGRLRWGRTIINVPSRRTVYAVVTSAPAGPTIIVCSVCDTIPPCTSRRAGYVITAPVLTRTLKRSGARGGRRWATRCANGSVLNSSARSRRNPSVSGCFCGFTFNTR